MEILSKSMEYALNDTFILCWYVAVIFCVSLPLGVAVIHDTHCNFRKIWMKKAVFITLMFFCIFSLILIIANFTCETPTGYYNYKAIFNDSQMQKEVFTTAEDIRYEDGVFTFRSLINYD